MKNIQNIGLPIFFIGFSIFLALPFFNKYQLSQNEFEQFIISNNFKSEKLIVELKEKFVNAQYSNSFSFNNTFSKTFQSVNNSHKNKQEWGLVNWSKPSELAFQLAKVANKNSVKNNKKFFWLLTFGFGILGGVLYSLASLKTLGPPGIKNNGVWHNSTTNRGWIGWLVFLFLTTFYVVLYFYPAYIVNWVYLTDPISLKLSNKEASQWFLYGFLYTVVMLVMGLKAYIKYRHSKYQTLRTTSVLFFQIVFAFLIPEIMVGFNKPWYDFKNAFPLDYDFFFSWNIDSLLNEGSLGLFILFWGIALTLIIVPIFTYFYGKRWYCTWVCGCGGLAETLGDPYRHLSNKKLKAWQLERLLIHSVLIFAVLMTAITLYSYFTGKQHVFGLQTQTIQDLYGFIIGSVFAGVIGTGFYPIFGNRVWCRFGCPLAAYMGIIQRFKSRFRITTNGGQCISCGNCSTYCEQGIDVRAYAQKGENIVRASCVGCGICSAVCPRGVLKLENGPTNNRINSQNILLGNDVNLIDYTKQK